jgi:hypothetical protein
MGACANPTGGTKLSGVSRVLVLLVLALAAMPAGALAAGPPAPPPELPARGALAAGPPAPPLELPARGASAARAGARAWLVGARPGAASRRVAARHGARRVLTAGAVYTVAPARARALADELDRAGLLEFAEPDRAARRRAFPRDPAFDQQQLAGVVGDLTPPPVTPTSPLVAILDSQVAAHPEFEGGALSLLDPAAPVTEWHGTAVASVAGAAANGVGMVGLWPGVRMLGIATTTSCSGSARAIEAAVAARASVLNMSYGGPPCYTEFVATQVAVRAGAVLVAAGGNEFLEGNQAEYPASYPHVVTVASVDRAGDSSMFSNENEGIDLSAPGEQVLAAVPPALDPDGDGDGYAAVDGTSFAAPQVSAAAAWVHAARPRLLPDQVASVLRAGSRDIGDRGWDQATGYGLLQVRGALTAAPDRAEPREPNDDVPFVDGTYFGRRQAPLFGARSRSRSIVARLDQWEDPSDVYRIVLPARRSLRITVRPSFGDADLAVFSSAARTIDRRRGLLARSLRGGRATDSVRVTNRSRRSRTAYVAVYVDRGISELDAGYRLSVSRSR